MSDKREIKRIPKTEAKPPPPPPHRLYMTFANIRSAALETARLILDECGENAPADVKRFLETQGKAT